MRHIVAKTLTIWRSLGRLAAICCLLAWVVPAQCQTQPSPDKPFIMVTDGESDTFGSRWITLIYTEVFKRLGMPLRIENYTLARRAAMVEAGLADGESSRVYGYGDSHPDMIRVEESLIDLGFSFYTANPSVHLARLEDLRTTNYLVEYRRGILLCENTIEKWTPAERVSDVLTQKQGLLKLLAKRTDLYCDLDLYVRQELQSPDVKAAGGATVRKVISIGDAVPTYPYLNKRYAALAPRMAAILKQMKAAGLIDAYQHQVERDLGWEQ